MRHNMRKEPAAPVRADCAGRNKASCAVESAGWEGSDGAGAGSGAAAGTGSRRRRRRGMRVGRVRGILGSFGVIVGASIARLRSGSARGGMCRVFV